MTLSAYGKYGSAASKLGDAIRSGIVSHAYIIEGDSNIDKIGFARAFCQALTCSEMPGEGCGKCVNCRKIADGNHEDLYVVEPDDTTASKNGTDSIKDAAVEELQVRLKEKPAAGDRADVDQDHARNKHLQHSAESEHDDDWCIGRGPHLQLRQEPQGSSDFRLRSQGPCRLRTGESGLVLG